MSYDIFVLSILVPFFNVVDVIKEWKIYTNIYWYYYFKFQKESFFHDFDGLSWMVDAKFYECTECHPCGSRKYVPKYFGTRNVENLTL